MDSTQGAVLPRTPWQPWSVFSRAAVVFLPGERRAAERVSQRLFGRALDPTEFAGLAGAPDDATVEVGASRGRLYLELGDPLAATYRGYYYLFCREPAVVLFNHGFHILLRAMQRRGLGLQVHYRQVRNALACGVSHIDLCAGRRCNENGYYTWPRYGFDCLLPASIRRRLPSDLRSSQTLLDLMSCEQGRHWWKRYGLTIRLRFDLAPGSRSQQVLVQYLRERTLTDPESLPGRPPAW
jgi:hypothetical protein